jgi:hypothetical protein
MSPVSNPLTGDESESKGPGTDFEGSVAALSETAVLL